MTVDAPGTNTVSAGDHEFRRPSNRPSVNPSWASPAPAPAPPWSTPALVNQPLQGLVELVQAVVEERHRTPLLEQRGQDPQVVPGAQSVLVQQLTDGPVLGMRPSNRGEGRGPRRPPTWTPGPAGARITILPSFGSWRDAPSSFWTQADDGVRAISTTRQPRTSGRSPRLGAKTPAIPHPTPSRGPARGGRPTNTIAAFGLSPGPGGNGNHISSSGATGV